MPLPPSSGQSAAAAAESRRMWRLAGMGGTLASEILAGVLIGWLADKIFGTKPILLVVMTIVGVLVGMGTFIRGALKESARAARQAEDIAEHHDLVPPDDETQEEDS